MSDSILLANRQVTVRPATWRPVSLPEMGVEQQRLQVGMWLTEMGEAVVVGDPLVEVMIKGIVFDVEAPVSGTLRRCELLDGDETRVGDVLGWIEADSVGGLSVASDPADGDGQRGPAE